MEIDDWMLCRPMEHMEPANHTQPSTSRIIPRIVAGWNVVNTSLKSLGIELYHWVTLRYSQMAMENILHFPIETSIEFGDFPIFWMDFLIFSHVFPWMDHPFMEHPLGMPPSLPSSRRTDMCLFEHGLPQEANLMFDHLIIIFPNEIGDHLCFLPHLWGFWCGYGSVYSVFLWCGRHNFVGSYGVPWGPTSTCHSRWLELVCQCNFRVEWFDPCNITKALLFPPGIKGPQQPCYILNELTRPSKIESVI